MPLPLGEVSAAFTAIGMGEHFLGGEKNLKKFLGNKKAAYFPRN